MREAEWRVQADEWWYAVNFGGRVESTFEDDLELVPETEEPWSQLQAGLLASAKAFHTLMTFERLAKPPSRVAESFGTARAVVYPFQFKPLLKFLESPGNRLLIADDVGLGKTVEAGYILRELRGHLPLERVLIVVPARLKPKWRDELARRFDERFELVDRATIRERLKRPIERGREPDPFAWVVSYEAVRAPDVLEFFREYRPALDLVILDEAHRARNPESLQHRVARELAECADALLLLTATPIQAGGREDLFHLLQLLDQEAFPSYPAFERLLDANRPVIRALDALRKHPADSAAAEFELQRLTRNPLTSSLARGDYFHSILSRAGRAAALSRDELVELQQDISELSQTGSLVSRTRKADVMPNRPRRIAQSPTFSLTPSEQRFYDAVGSLIRLTKPQESDWAAAMVCLMYYRCAASCIPAAVKYFEGESRKWSDDVLRAVDEETEGQFEGLDLENAKATAGGSLQEIRARLGEILATVRPEPGIDTKFKFFWSCVQEVWREDREGKRPSRKVIVFSYFKRTLAYLSEELEGRGIEHRLISGDVPIAERENRIEDFLERQDVQVLLSSEVGSEGLDLQKASVVINYDLPWNPMVVEQRIGRVDRIGQQSPVINIINLVTADTVEERILNRLFWRIGLFEDTLGEIEPILGERIEALALKQLRGELTADEEERQLLELERTLARTISDAKRLAEEGDSLIAADQAFLDEIDALTGRRKVPNAPELHRYLKAFLSERYRGAELPDETIRGVALVTCPREMAAELQMRFPGDPGARRFASRIEEGSFPSTFSPEAVLEHPRAEFLTARHLLTRFAVETTGRTGGATQRAFALGVPEIGGFDSGWHAFTIRQCDIRGTRNRVEIIPIVCRLDSAVVFSAEESFRFFVTSLDIGQAVSEAPPFSGSLIDRAVEVLKERTAEIEKELSDRERLLNDARAARLHANDEALHKIAVERERRRLEALRGRDAREHAIRSAEGRLRAAIRRLEEHAQTDRRGVPFGFGEIHVACGLVVVGSTG